MTKEKAEAEVGTEPGKARRPRHRLAIKDGPEPVDIHVGARVRLRRTLMGMSQVELGRALHLTFQQIQKYERGANRVSASTLYRLATVLDVPVSFFFDDFSEGPKPPAALPGGADSSGRESLELLRNYYNLDEPVRRKIYGLIKNLNKES